MLEASASSIQPHHAYRREYVLLCGIWIAPKSRFPLGSHLTPLAFLRYVAGSAETRPDVTSFRWTLRPLVTPIPH